MKMLVEGVMNGNLPWGLIFIGIFIAIAVEILRIPVLPVAIGLYLPLELSTCIMLGGLIRLFLEKRKLSEEDKKRKLNNGILFSSGMIAGEGLVGIFLAILAVLSVEQSIDLSQMVNTGIIGGSLLILVILFCLHRSSR